jgi:hypothetical protein
VDSDSASPLRGVAAKLSLGTPPGVVDLRPGGSPGQFVAPVGQLPAGPLHVELPVRNLPGAEPVLPYDGSWEAMVVPGQRVQVAAELGQGSGSAFALVLSVAGAVVLIALLYLLFSTRRVRT